LFAKLQIVILFAKYFYSFFTKTYQHSARIYYASYWYGDYEKLRESERSAYMFIHTNRLIDWWT